MLQLYFSLPGLFFFMYKCLVWPCLPLYMSFCTVKYHLHYFLNHVHPCTVLTCVKMLTWILHDIFDYYCSSTYHFSVYCERINKSTFKTLKKRLRQNHRLLPGLIRCPTCGAHLIVAIVGRTTLLVGVDHHINKRTILESSHTLGCKYNMAESTIAHLLTFISYYMMQYTSDMNYIHYNRQDMLFLPGIGLTYCTSWPSHSSLHSWPTCW